MCSTCMFVHAQDRQFVRTYQTTTLPKGSRDIETWVTWRTGRQYFYNRLDTRLEFETGLTKRLQTALYINASHTAYGASIDTLGRIADTSSSAIFHSSEFSVSSEWKYKVTPLSSPFGFTVYAEFGLSPAGFEIENKLIFDYRADKNIFALNLVNECEVEYEVEHGEKETEVEENEPEIDLAYMHMFRPNFGIGMEMVNSNEIEKGSWNFSALYGGPTLFYSGNNYFFILNALPQWTNLRKTDDAPNNLVLNAREKMEVRLLCGFSL